MTARGDCGFSHNGDKAAHPREPTGTWVLFMNSTKILCTMVVCYFNEYGVHRSVKFLRLRARITGSSSSDDGNELNSVAHTELSSSNAATGPTLLSTTENYKLHIEKDLLQACSRWLKFIIQRFLFFGPMCAWLKTKTQIRARIGKITSIWQ